MRFIFILLLKFFFTPLYSQTFDKWAQTVNWDGVSHWSRYMITQPGFQGPNSLPVPRVGNGTVDSNIYIGITGNLHYSKGDDTRNIMIYANYGLVKDLISLDLMWVPHENYSMTDSMKLTRHVYPDFYNEKATTGDIILNTNIQLLNKWRKYVHLVFRIGYRFPSGSGFGAARYTDGPGYHLDLSWGKKMGQSPFKWIGMLGFYVWQVESDKFNQNDAFLFGTGLEWNNKFLKLQTTFAGYAGYLQKAGDGPMMIRVNMEKWIKKTSLVFAFQQGVHDFNYTSVEFGAKYNLNSKR